MKLKLTNPSRLLAAVALLGLLSLQGHAADRGAGAPAAWARIISRTAVKTNLLYYAILMPNVEVEYKFSPRWSAAFEAQGAWYAKEEPHKVYRIASYTPEARYWIISRSRWHGLYAGLFFGFGPYDLSNGKPGSRGHEGHGIMAGISAGYMWPVGKHLSLEAALGLGYLHASDKEYLPADGHYLYQLSKNVGYFGPLRLRLALVYRFDSLKKFNL